MSSPGDRVIFGAGPVREVIARRPKDVKEVWVDPRRAERASHDPISTIVGTARAAGIRVEDRQRADLDRAAGEGARHQGVVAWLGEFVYADLDDVVASPD